MMQKGLVLLALLLLSLPLAAEIGVPQLKGLSHQEAASKLRQAGLSIEVQRVISQGEPDLVLSQQPAPGRQVEKGSSVLLQVSRSAPEPPQLVAPTGDAPKTRKRAGKARRLLGLLITQVFFLAALGLASQRLRRDAPSQSRGVTFEGIRLLE